jgi:transporter family-2 protein
MTNPELMIGLCSALSAGVLTAFQPGANGRFGDAAGHRVHGAVLNFAVGLLGVVLALLVWATLGGVPGLSIPALGGGPLWMWGGGLLGAFFVTVSIIANRALGSAQYIAFYVVGQLLTSLVIDHYGWMGMPLRAVTPVRVLGVMAILAGLAMIRFLGAPASASIAGGWSAWAKAKIASLTVVAGAAAALQPGVNIRFGEIAGHRLYGAVLNFGVGLLAMIVARRVWSRFERVGAPDVAAIRRGPWWMWIGGACGAYFVVMAVLMGERFGNTNFFAAMVGGQLITSLFIDHFGGMGLAKVRINPARVFGALLIGAGMVAIKFG